MGKFLESIGLIDGYDITVIEKMTNSNCLCIINIGNEIAEMRLPIRFSNDTSLCRANVSFLYLFVNPHPHSRLDIEV